MNLIQINNSQETFTSTASGAIATHIWETCRVARREGVKACVITREAPETPLPGVEIHPIAAIVPAVSKLGRFWERAERRLTGWRQAGQRTHAKRVLRLIRERSLMNGSFILHNDPELAVVLREEFPRARVLHHFHNPVRCSPQFARKFGRLVSNVSAVSAHVAQSVGDMYGCPKVSVVYNGVDAERFRPKSAPKGGPVTVNFLGRTGLEKAPDLFLKACLRLVREGLGLRVQLVGSNHWGRWEADRFQSELSALCAELERFGAEVIRTGHVGRDSIPAMLQQADIHVVPSRWDEPCALSLLEGMAAGLAVVASRTGGTPEVLGTAGRLFRRNDELELAGHLRDLVLRASERQRLGELARARAQEFSWGATWRQFASLCA